MSTKIKQLKEEKKETEDKLSQKNDSKGRSLAISNNNLTANVDELSLLLLHTTHPIDDNDEDDRLALSLNLYSRLFNSSVTGPFCFSRFNCSLCDCQFKFITMIDKIYWKTTARKIPNGLGYLAVCGKCTSDENHDASYYVGKKFREGLWRWYEENKHLKEAQEYFENHQSCFYGEEEGEGEEEDVSRI